MKFAVVCFTERGALICRRLYTYFNSRGVECVTRVPTRFLKEEWKKDGMSGQAEELSWWTGRQFEEKNAVIFVGAVGIAVRAIAPWVKDKLSDPPVVAVDEAGRFCVPLLSGHVGGANELALEIADELGAAAVVTTATDVNGLFAADLFAAGNGLEITDRREAKEISARILEGEPVGFFSDFQVDQIPRGCEETWHRHNIWVTVRTGLTEKGGQRDWPCGILRDSRPGEGYTETSESAGILRLVPKAVVLGIGCRRGVPPELLRIQVKTVLSEAGIDWRGVKRIASIDLKKDEPAILILGAEEGINLQFYTAEELKKVKGTFFESPFVENTVGIGNVCERAACGEGGRLIFGKTAGNGVTVAAALEEIPLLKSSCGFGRKD